MDLVKICLFLIILKLCHALLQFPSYKHHECNRKCIKGITKVCNYELTIETMVSMAPECGACPKTEKDCFNSECIAADGNARMVTIFNRMFPGPSIEVCLGDTINVTFANRLTDAESSVHWHGVHQKESPFMDGVPMVTQCPVLPGTNFQYTFKAGNAGTHYYHSHVGVQLPDGAFGPLIIREPMDKQLSKLYNHDLSEHVLVINDWYFNNTLYHYNQLYRMKIHETLIVSGILLNGILSTTNNTMPIQIFKVKRGSQYRFRVIQAGIATSSMSIQVQKHKLTVIANRANPVEVDTVFIGNGERIDFVINADQPVGFYWIKLKGYFNSAGLTTIALLQYESDKKITKIPARATAHFDETSKKIYNCVNEFLNNTKCIFPYQIKGSKEHDLALKKVPDFKYYLGIQKVPYVKPVYRGVNDSILNTGAINNITWRYPPRPLIFGEGLTTCKDTNSKECDPNEEQCECTYVVELPLHSTVEMIIVDESTGVAEPHPMHLHGHRFRLIGQECLDSNINIKAVKELDRNNRLVRNLHFPPYMDSLSVSTNGYVIIRFYTDNPGYWFMHCHNDRHMLIGMGLVFKIGNVTKLPSDFPICGKYEYYKHMYNML